MASKNFILTFGLISWLFVLTPIALCCRGGFRSIIDSPRPRNCVSSNVLFDQLVRNSDLGELSSEDDDQFVPEIIQNHENPDIFMVGFRYEGSQFFVEKSGNNFKIVRRSPIVPADVPLTDSRWFERKETGRNNNKYKHVASRTYVTLIRFSDAVLATAFASQATAFCLFEF